MRRRVFNYAILAMILLLMGCGNSRIQAGVDTGISPPQQDLMPPLTGNLPFPDDLQAPAKNPEAISGYQKLGKERYRDSADAVINGNDLKLMPAAGNLSWAIYSMGDGFLKDTDVLKTVSTAFTAPQPDRYYLAIANFETGRWQMLERLKSVSTTEEDPVEIPAGLKAISPGGRCYIAVLLWDSLPATISTVTITVDISQMAPIAALSGTPASGNAALLVSFDASASYDVDLIGTIASYEWDWEGDGVFDDSGPDALVQHQYEQVGIYEPLLRVTDSNDGLQDSAQLRIVVQGWGHTLGSAWIEDTRALDNWQNEMFSAGWAKDPDSADYDGLLLRYDFLGNPRWLLHWGEAGNRDFFYDISCGAGRDCCVTGNTDGYGSQGTAMIVVRFDRHGNELWARSWDTSGDDRGFSIDLDNAGNCYAFGSTDGFSLSGDNEAVLLKYDPAGNLLWEKILSNDDELRGEAVDWHSSGDIFLAMSSWSYGAGSAVSVTRLSSAGLILQEDAVELPETAYATDLQVDISGRAYVCGYYGNNSTTDVDGFCCKLLTDGSISWVRHWDTGSHQYNQGILLKYGPLFQVSDVYICGYARSGSDRLGVLLHYDSAGGLEQSLQWTSPGSGVQLNGISNGLNGSLLLCGYAEKSDLLIGPVAGSNILLSATHHNGTCSISNASANSQQISAPVLFPPIVADNGGGFGDAWLGSYIPGDL